MVVPSRGAKATPRGGLGQAPNSGCPRGRRVAELAPTDGGHGKRRDAKGVERVLPARGPVEEPRGRGHHSPRGRGQQPAVRGVPRRRPPPRGPRPSFAHRSHGAVVVSRFGWHHRSAAPRSFRLADLPVRALAQRVDGEGRKGSDAAISSGYCSERGHPTVVAVGLDPLESPPAPHPASGPPAPQARTGPRARRWHLRRTTPSPVCTIQLLSNPRTPGIPERRSRGRCGLGRAHDDAAVAPPGELLERTNRRRKREPQRRREQRGGSYTATRGQRLGSSGQPPAVAGVAPGQPSAGWPARRSAVDARTL